MPSEILNLTAQIVISHASMSELTPKALVAEIKTIYNVLASLESKVAVPEIQSPVKRQRKPRKVKMKESPEAKAVENEDGIAGRRSGLYGIYGEPRGVNRRSYPLVDGRVRSLWTWRTCPGRRAWKPGGHERPTCFPRAGSGSAGNRYNRRPALPRKADIAPEKLPQRCRIETVCLLWPELMIPPGFTGCAANRLWSCCGKIVMLKAFYRCLVPVIRLAAPVLRFSGTTHLRPV